MERTTSPKKKLKSPGVDVASKINYRTSVTCSNVPECLFEAPAASKHFSKFGKVQKIKLCPKRQICVVEYDQPISAERAVLNAGAYDGFMFEVSRTKARIRRKSRKEDDPDWIPDSDVEDELSAMRGAPTYKVTRQKPMELESPKAATKVLKKPVKLPARVKPPIREKRPVVSQPASGRESPVIAPTQTSMSTSEAAAELHQLRFRVSLTPDEQWRTLDARDRILRAWGGAGSRVKVGGATIGTCPDMCPEKELLHRQAEHQTMTLETVPGSDGVMEPRRAVKQYSRSSADQEIPMCYELRPAPVLLRTCAYLLHHIADTDRQVTLADWFHFMWDRLRGIRKDITQQALCCADSIRLVEMCARFHAHCAARLADLEHTQFDQKLNTDNLTKCLQTLKHMYGDVGPELKPCEAEFRGYIALLNLGDANFWWEIKQLPTEIQKSRPITFAIKVFNALDNNNYVRFFRLVREEATYLQACILLRYFNDVRARALARIVRAFAARGGSKYPAEDLMKTLSFESTESLRSFIVHYGLRFAKDETELAIILARNQFIEDSDPYPIARAIRLIESKRHCTVGEVIAGGILPYYDENCVLYTSFNRDGKLKEASLIAEEQGYNTLNDSNKDVQALKAEIQRLAQGGRSFIVKEKPAEIKSTLFVKPDTRSVSPSKPSSVYPATNDSAVNKSFSFKPAIPVAPSDVIKKSPDKIFAAVNKNTFSFSKPQGTIVSNDRSTKDTGNIFKSSTGGSLFAPKTTQDSGSLFARKTNANKDPYPNSQGLFKKPDEANIFRKQDTETKNGEINKNLFSNAAIQNSIGNKNIFNKIQNDESSAEDGKRTNIFAQAINSQTNDSKNPVSVFGSFAKPNAFSNANSLFAKTEQTENQTKSLFTSNGDVSPGTLFKSANSADGKGYSIFQSKNKTPVADNIFNSVNSNNNIYDFKEDNEEELKQKLEEEKVRDMERKIEEQMKQEEEKRREQQEQRRREEERRKEEERKKQEELRKLEEKRRMEEKRRQEELKKRLEEERKAELKRKAEELERKFKERVEKESNEVSEELVDEVRDETVKDILKEEIEKMKKMMSYAVEVSDEVWKELCDEIAYVEMLAEKFWTDKLKKKWFQVWKTQFLRNCKRRCLLEDTPIWLPDRTPIEEAARLRRKVENATLSNMNAIHRGYKFTGELHLLPNPEPYNIMEIIRSSFLKRMKQINYPYDKCFFWKVTLVSPWPNLWIGRKLEIEKWISDAFSDKRTHDVSETLIRLEKQSWNNLMDFAISVSMTKADKKNLCSEALEGTNGLLFYTSEDDHHLNKRIEEVLHQKYPFQIIPVTVIMPNYATSKTKIQETLTDFVNRQLISCYKIFVLDHQNICESLNATTKSALKWMAKKYPIPPPLEVDSLKSICERYLGNEVWCKFRSERDGRMTTIRKDLYKLVECYNDAVNRLTEVITNEDLFNYAPFPLEFKYNLNQELPFPLPYEFIPTSVRNCHNISSIRDTMAGLRLPEPSMEFHPVDVVTMQGQIRKYCNQIEWFEDPEKVVCKVVAKLPTQFCDIEMPSDQFIHFYESYDLIDFLNILVYEKISKLRNIDMYAMYEKSALQEYRNMDWIYETKVLSRMKHKALDSEDELDLAIEAKRRKIAIDSMEYLALEEADCTMVEKNIKSANESITKYSNCKVAVRQLEEQIELERKKSMELENLLRSALNNV